MNSTNLYELTISNNGNGVNLIFSKVFKIIKIIFFLLAGVLLYITLMVNFNFFIFGLIALIIGFFFNYLQGLFDCSYDYVYVDGSLRFTKIVRSTKRRRIANFDCKDIENLYLVNSPNYLKKARKKDFKLLRAISKFNSDIKIGINYVYNGKEFMLLIKVERSFLSYILKRLNSRKIDKDLLDYLSGKYE